MLGLSASEIALVALLFLIVMAPSRLGAIGEKLGAMVGKLRGRRREDGRIVVRPRDEG